MEYNTRETLEHYKGKIWITKRNGGKNVCAEMSNGKFVVLAYLDNDQQKNLDENIRGCITSFGWNADEWLKD